MIAAITRIQSLDGGLEEYLAQIGTIFRAFREQDSGCISYGLDVGAQRFFVKHSNQARGIASLQRSLSLNTSLSHPVLPPLLNSFTTPGGMGLVFAWAEGEVLYDYTRYRGEGRNDPSSPHSRFRRLPVEEILAALDTIFELHLLLANAGYVAVDFYDGCILYDFEQRKLHLCDLDEYRKGAFILASEQLPGSKRFMAPEEFHRGALIDQVTNVYTLGRTAAVLLGDGSLSVEAWRGSPQALEVVQMAAQKRREDRYSSIENFVAAWRAAVASDPMGS